MSMQQQAARGQARKQAPIDTPQMALDLGLEVSKPSIIEPVIHDAAIDAKGQLVKHLVRRVYQRPRGVTPQPLDPFRYWGELVIGRYRDKWYWSVGFCGTVSPPTINSDWINFHVASSLKEAHKAALANLKSIALHEASIAAKYGHPPLVDMLLAAIKVDEYQETIT